MIWSLRWQLRQKDGVSLLLSKFAKLLLTGTAIAPVCITYAWVAYSDGNSSVALTLLAICVLLVVIALLLLKYVKTHVEKVSFTPVSIEAADRENIAFLLLYLLPLFTAQFDSLNWQIWIPTLLVFGVVVGTGYGYHFNPLLGIIGWHFYKVGTEEGVTYVLITRKQLRAAKQQLTVGELTEYIVIDIED